MSVRVTYIDSYGTSRNVDAAEGTSVMEAARLHHIPEVGSDCGGVCSCASCHVYVDAAWLDKFPTMTANEKVLLSLLGDQRHENSRLSCQLKLDEAVDGLVVHTLASDEPESP